MKPVTVGLSVVILASALALVLSPLVVGQTTPSANSTATPQGDGVLQLVEEIVGVVMVVAPLAVYAAYKLTRPKPKPFPV